MHLRGARVPAPSSIDAAPTIQSSPSPPNPDAAPLRAVGLLHAGHVQGSVGDVRTVVASGRPWSSTHTPHGWLDGAKDAGAAGEIKLVIGWLGSPCLLVNNCYRFISLSCKISLPFFFIRSFRYLYFCFVTF
jgi:hypothetical protein